MNNEGLEKLFEQHSANIDDSPKLMMKEAFLELCQSPEFREMVVGPDGWKALSEKQDEYIKLLADELSEVVPFASVHNWKSQRYDVGVKLREEMTELRKIISQPIKGE